MKKLLPFILLSFTLASNAQLTLTKAQFDPAIGDTSRYYIIDTSYYTGGLNLGLTGANTLWTYANLAASGNSVTTAYVDPSTVPASANYTGCTIVAKQGPLNSFYKAVTSPSVQTEFQGISSNTITMNFNNTAVNMRYPFAFGNTIIDNFSGSFTFSLSGTASGNATVTADGTGTLVLPNGQIFNDVLRVKSVQNTGFSALIINGNMKQTIYSWYHASQKFPVLTVNYQSMSITGSTSPTVSAQVLGNKNNFVIGLKEASEEISSLIRIFPIPAVDIIQVVSNDLKTGKICVTDVCGKTVLSFPAGTHELIVTSLTPGIYFAEIHTEKGVLRKKFIKQ